MKKKMRKATGFRRFTAVLIAASVVGGELWGSGIGFKVYAAEPDVAEEETLESGFDEVVASDELDFETGLDEEIWPEDVLDEDDASSEIMPLQINVEKVAWDTGVAVIGAFCPGGKALAPFLNALWSLNESGPTMQDVSNKINDVSKEINAVSGQLTAFRAEMNTRLDELQKNLSGEINSALNKVKNDIFIDGVGSELDTLHAQLNDENGIASKIDTINKSKTLSDKAKAVEIAYLIGNDKEWGETQNALYRFDNLSDLLAGTTYRDTKGRNLYQVLYDNAALDSMFTGEAYDRIDPYIDRVVYEYWYDYTVLVQCLSAHLVVSRMTDAEAKALGAAEYNKYKKCRTPTSLVKEELDELEEDLFDAKSESSIISLYSTFKYKKEHDRLVFINKGTTAIAVAGEFDKISNDWTGKRNSGEAKAGSDFAEHLADNPTYKPYYQGQVDFVSGDTHLSPAYIKGIYEHVRSLPQARSFYDYLKDMGFDVGKQRGDKNACFAISDMKKDVWGDFYQYYRTCEFSFDSFDPEATGEANKRALFFRMDEDRYTVVYYKMHKGKKVAKNRYTRAVYLSRYDVSFLGLKKIDRAGMPKTAYELSQIDGALKNYTLTAGTKTAALRASDDGLEPYAETDGALGAGFELYEKYDLREMLPVTISDEDGQDVVPDGDYRISFTRADNSDGVSFDGDSIVSATAPGSYAFRAVLTDPINRTWSSEPIRLDFVDNHKSDVWEIRGEEVSADISIPINQTIELSQYIKAGVYGKDGIKQEAAVITYECDAGALKEGMEFDQNTGEVTFKKPANLKFRVKSRDTDGNYAYGEWVEFRAKDPENCYTMFFLDADGTTLHKIIAPEGKEINNMRIVVDEKDLTETAPEDVSDAEEDEEDEEILFKKANHNLTGWDLLEENGSPDGEKEEIPEVMPGGDTTYYAMWERVIQEGYVTVENAEALQKAVFEASASQTTKIALKDDMEIGKLSLPMANDADIMIDGMGHTITFGGNASIALKNKQSFTLEDITLKALNRGKPGNITITAAAGGLTLDDVEFNAKQATVNASKGNLILRNILDNELIVKGGSKTELKTYYTVWAGSVTGFERVTVSGLLIPYKALKVKELKLESDGRINVKEGALINLSKGIQGTGTIYLEEGFSPLTFGTGNSGCIILSSDEPLSEHELIFKSKDKNLATIFRTEDILPEVTDGSYKYGLYSEKGNVYLRAYRLKLGSKSYCEWGDLVGDINKGKEANDKTITLLGDYDIDGVMKLPSKGKCNKLTINGGGHELTFKGKKVSVGCDIVFRQMTVRSASGAWSISKGKYTVTCDNAKLIGCSVK